MNINQHNFALWVHVYVCVHMWKTQAVSCPPSQPWRFHPMIPTILETLQRRGTKFSTPEARQSGESNSSLLPAHEVERLAQLDSLQAAALHPPHRGAGAKQREPAWGEVQDMPEAAHMDSYPPQYTSPQQENLVQQGTFHTPQNMPTLRKRRQRRIDAYKHTGTSTLTAHKHTHHKHSTNAINANTHSTT